MKLKQVPNAICLLRIGLVPILWILALTQHRHLFAGLLAFTYFTDAADGYLARKYRLATTFGAWIDTVADNLVTFSTIGWAYLLLPELFREHGLLIGLLVAAFVGSIVLQYVRFGKRVPLHLYSNKISAWLLAAFVLHALVFGPCKPFMYVAAAVVGYSLIEEIVLVITRRDLDEDVRSVFSRWFRRREPAEAE